MKKPEVNILRERLELNRGWEFTETFSEDFASGASCAFEQVELPHTCKLTPYHYFDEGIYQMDCAYRRVLHVPEEWAEREVVLCIGAAGHSATVYVNGQAVGEHHCGYTSFRTRLPVKPGEDAVICVRVNSREDQDIPPFGFVIDYMTFGGLYREAWLEVLDDPCIADVFATPRIPGTVKLFKTEPTAEQVRNTRFAGQAENMVTLRVTEWHDFLSLRQSVYRKGEEDGAPLATRETELKMIRDNEQRGSSLLVSDAQLWDVKSPTLYTLRTELLESPNGIGEGKVLDRVDITFGFRIAEFKSDGFYLNGRKLKLMGLNRHQSYPYIGYAAPKSLQRMDAELLKNELGLNAVRTSHYPQSQHFIDRCDELGLLVFTEIPGWQHIGGEAWKAQAVKNVEDMVRQYRNHPSIILWGVRINESQDDDALYKETNSVAHRFDPTRPTGGVRCNKKSSLLEDVYTYNDFVHDGTNNGCEPKRAVTSDMKKAYFVSEYNGHMFPTKPFDSEEHRLEHALRHAKVLDSIAAEKDIAGSFGWCMFDYNTHRDFGSGDRICYHGVMDMFRNPKLAAAVYAVQQDETPVLEVSSTMDIGEHPASNRGRIFLFTNADEVRMYQNGKFIRSYTHKDSPYKHLRRGPIEVDDFIGDRIKEGENFAAPQAKFVKDMLNHSARFGMGKLPPDIMAKAGVLMARYKMTFDDAYQLYGKYIGNWGAAATVFKFEAVKNGKVVKTVECGPVLERKLQVKAGSTVLVDGDTYDMAMVRIQMTDQVGNVLPFEACAVELEADGPIEIVGPKTAMIRGGFGGTYVKTAGEAGEAKLTLSADGVEPVQIAFTIEKA